MGAAEITTVTVRVHPEALDQCGLLAPGGIPTPYERAVGNPVPSRDLFRHADCQ